MLVYLLKSIACLAILFVFYKVFLEKENMHVFKRFYLLGALLFSMIIPSLVFTEYVMVEPEPMVTISTPVIMQQADYSNDVINVPQALETDVIDIAPLLWGVYFIGLFFFGLKFLRNLFQIYRRIRKNPKQKLSRFTQVLLQEKLTPHTFFSYIFLNKKKFEADQIPHEVLLHEQTHASQKHSWDVILVELLHVIFWINPFIYLTKKAIKLNHEFLADQAVLRENIDKTTYQNTLLSYLSPDSEKKYQPLANAINYSSIKKRFTVMKTHTSKKAVLLRSLLLLPLLAVLIYGFSERTVKEKTSSEHTSILINDLVVEVDDHGNLSLNNKKLELNEIGKEAKLLTDKLTNGERKNFITAHILYNEEHLESIEHVQSQLFEVGIHQINHVSKKTSTALGRPNFTPSKYQNKTIEEARAIQKETFAWHESIWFDIKNENEIWYEDKLIPLEDLAEKILKIASTKNEENNIKVQFYSTGILHSNFVDKINAEAQKANVKEVQVFTEEQIVPESDFTENREQILIAETIDVHITKTGEILVQDQMVAIENVSKVLSKYNADLSKEEKSKIVAATIHIETGAAQKTIQRIQEILTEYGSATIDITEWSETKDLEKIWISIMNEDELWINNQQVQLDELAAKLSSISASQELKNQLKIKIYSEKKLHQNFLNKITKEIDKVGALSVQVFSEEYIMSESDFAKEGINPNNAKIHLKTNKMTLEKDSENKYEKLFFKFNEKGQLSLNNKIIPKDKVLEELKKNNYNSLEGHSKVHIYAKNASEKDINSLLEILRTIGIDHVGIITDTPTAKQIAEYNVLAKKYNTMLSKSRSIQIKMKEVERLEYIYGLMSKKQKAAAEPFPDFPEPPPVPDAPKTPNEREQAANIIENIIEEQDPYDNVHAVFYSANNKKGKAKTLLSIPSEASAPRVLKGEVSDIPKPPKATKAQKAQKAPKVLKGKVDNQDKYGADNVRVYQHKVGESNNSSPNLMKSIASLAKRDAQFYLDGNEISTKAGLQIVKSKKNILVETHPYVNKTPEVRIHTNPTEVSIPAPPQPPEPIAPLDHVIEMAKRNATFYLEGKEITSDEAIAVMKKNKEMNIDSRSAKGKRPVVKLSTAPMNH